MFSETRYALNGDLRVAYRASREGPRDIVFVPNWFTNCEVFPELPSIQGVGRGDDIARSTDLLRPAGHRSVRSRHAGRAADLGAMGRQHHRGARRSRESRSGPPRVDGAFAPAALFAATHPSRTTALVVLEGYADPMAEPHSFDPTKKPRCDGRRMWGTGEFQHLINPDMPWNEEIRATWARWNAWRPAQGPSLS